MRRTFAVVMTLVVAAATAGPLSAAVFQYAVPVKTARGESQAFLWLPPRAERVRGLLVCGMTLAERDVVQDPRLRAACTAESLGIVFLKTGLGSVDLPAVLDDLTRASGYKELTGAPLFFFGHSAGGPQARALTVKMAARCFGVVQYRGGLPGGPDPIPPGVPALMMIGQFDEFGGLMRDDKNRETWEGGRDGLAAFRAAGAGHLGSLVVEPGAGHFAWSDRNAAYLALFLTKAARARIPAAPAEGDGPVHCRDIDPRTGWLTDLPIRTPGESPAAPFDKYPGDRARTAWHFDEEMARATLAYHAGGFGKKDQFLRWQDPVWVDAGVRHFFTSLKWVDDGQTFEVHPVPADTYPKAQRNGPRWAAAGQPVGHSPAPVTVRPVGGSPVAAVGPNRLRLRFHALAPASEGGRVTFLASSPGDEQYRATELVGMMPRGFAGLKNGREQTITFPPPGDLTPESPPLPLKATSDAGLPVEFYVASGPAVVEDGQLRVVEIPARATFPIAVKVVAWQFGRGVETLVKTAAPVEQTLWIRKPR